MTGDASGRGPGLPESARRVLASQDHQRRGVGMQIADVLRGKAVGLDVATTTPSATVE